MNLRNQVSMQFLKWVTEVAVRVDATALEPEVERKTAPGGHHGSAVGRHEAGDLVGEHYARSFGHGPVVCGVAAEANGLDRPRVWEPSSVRDAKVSSGTLRFGISLLATPTSEQACARTSTRRLTSSSPHIARVIDAVAPHSVEDMTAERMPHWNQRVIKVVGRVVRHAEAFHHAA